MYVENHDPVTRPGPTIESSDCTWDGGFVATPGVHSAAVGGLLCIAGAATLASVGWGLKDQGLYCVATMVIALIAARRLASDPQRVCAASLPARMT
jgi:hypothetical protein